MFRSQKAQLKTLCRTNADLGALVSKFFPLHEICVVASLPEQTVKIILWKVTTSDNVANPYTRLCLPSIALKFEKFKYINYIGNMWHYQCTSQV